MKVITGFAAIATAACIAPYLTAAGGEDKIIQTHHQNQRGNSPWLNYEVGWRQLQYSSTPNNEDLYHQRHHRSLAFGDYVDPSFSCPVTVTCNIVCVANIEDCPADALCPGTHPDYIMSTNHTYELCADGTCADTTAGQICDPEVVSPCSCEALPLACAKQVDLLPDCSLRFQALYDANAQCLELQTESLPQLNFTEPGFVTCYVGLSAVTILMFLWCAYNQRWASVKGSTVRLESPKDTEFFSETKLHHQEEWFQTGYKTTFVGMTLYALIILTHGIIHYLLLALIVEFYVQDGAISTSLFGSQQFFDQVQVLLAFIITWMIGFVWCFVLKVPASIHSLFLRRCVLENASYVAVTVPVKAVDGDVYKNKCAKVVFISIHCIQNVLAFLFSDESLHSSRGRQYKVTFCKVKTDAKTGTRYFYFRFRRYIYNESLSRFIPGFFDVNRDTVYGSWLDRSYLHHGLSQEEATKRLGIVGQNVLDLKKPMLLSAIFTEFSKPFYLYQTYAVYTWGLLYIYVTALVYAVVQVIGGFVVACFKYIGDRSLYQLLVTDGTVKVIRDGKISIIDQIDIVPGDVICLEPGLAFFDMAILQASTVLVDESALTGEAHPIAKLPLDPANADLTYNAKTNKSSTISAGTSILECSEAAGIEGDLAIVTKTGSFTSKGELLSDVLSYERQKFKFDTEVKLVLIILLLEALVMLSVVLTVVKDDWVYGWLYAIYVVETVFPPILPTVFVVSVGISCKRLQSKRITCSESSSILVAGKVKKVCFDKTGTLTKQGMEYLSCEAIDQASNISLKRGLAVCQTLNLSNDGDLIGRTVDRMGFAATAAEMVGQNTIRHEGMTYRYLKRFEFDHHRMTQSVIVKYGNETVIYVKGSPEAISKLCVPTSLPPDFNEKTRQSAREGVYQLAMATAVYPNTKDMSDVRRDDIERDLDFVGFINFENKLREDSPAVINELRHGNVDCVTITGDNVLTGLHIAIQAGMINPDIDIVIGNSINIDGGVEWINASDDSPAKLNENTSIALTGEVWDYVLKNDPESALNYAKRTKVFGRCTPNDKVSIVSTFAEMGEIVLMCGDGGNDCGALKAAHVGIALSDAEASVVAPFSSLDKSILSVTEVLREGRCALASALTCYKYIIIFGQLTSILQVVNAYLHVNFTEWCWFFVGALWTLSMGFSLPLAKSAKTLSKSRPTASILGPHTVSSACGILVINFLSLVISLRLLWQQDWFTCRRWDSTDVTNAQVIGDNYETSVIFVVVGYQYISSAATLNFGYSFRSNWFRNYVFVFFFLLWTAMHFTATLTASRFSCIWRLNCDNSNVVRLVTIPDPIPIQNKFNTTVMPMTFRAKLVALMVANLILSCAWDYFVVNRQYYKLCVKKKNVQLQHRGVVSG